MVLLTGASCATAGAAGAIGTSPCCGFFLQAQNPNASDHEVVAGLASSWTVICWAEAGGGRTVTTAGAIAAGFSLLAAAATVISLWM